MRKLLIAFMIILFGAQSIDAGPALPMCTSFCIDRVISDSCNTMCLACKEVDITTDQTAGIRTDIRRRFFLECPDGNHCSCENISTTYSCISGWYGTPTSSLRGCARCPASATCAGGTTFVCNAGYYRNGSVCTRCVSATGNPNATSLAGATSITGCYVPGGTTGSDASGSFEFTSDCNYSN